MARGSSGRPAGGTVRASSATLRGVAEAWVAWATAGAIRNRSGDVYKPSVVRSYNAGLPLRVLPDLGARRLTDIERSDLQSLVDRMVVDGDGASTIRNALLPVRAIYRRALARGDVAVSPTTGPELPAARGIASPRPTRPSSSSPPSRATARCGRRRCSPACAEASYAR